MYIMNCMYMDEKPYSSPSHILQVRFLICTDVAARGLDIKGLPYMINVTLPDEKSNYVHRLLP